MCYFDLHRLFTRESNLTNLIAQQMEDIGVKVNITSQDVAAARAKATEGDYEAMVEGISNAVASTLTSINLARIHRFIQVDGVRTAEGCEGVTGAIIRA